MSKFPVVSFSNNELATKPIVKAGDKIVCGMCGELHVLEMSKRLDEATDTMIPDDHVMFFKCDKMRAIYLGAIGYRLVSGSLPS